MTATAPADRDAVDLALHQLRRALNGSTADAAADRAAVGFVRIARRAGLDLDRLAAAFVPPPLPAEPTLPAAWFVRMPGGRMAGLTLGHVAQNDLPLLRWTARKSNDLDLRDAAAVVLAYVTGRHADRGPT